MDAPDSADPLGPLDPADPADDELVVRLRGIAARADPVPAALLTTARASFGLRDLDARVAALVRDSAVDATATPVRGLGGRLLSFEAAEVVIECEVTAHGPRRHLIGQLVGAVATALHVQVSGAEVAGAEVSGAEVAGTEAVGVPVDEHGRFSVAGLPAGLLRLRCSLADGTTLVTSWASV